MVGKKRKKVKEKKKNPGMRNGRKNKGIRK
jgi:hypothetical protein